MKEKRAFVNYRKKGIKKSSVIKKSRGLKGQKNRSCNKDRHTLLYKGGWGSSPLRFRASGNKKKENSNLELNYKLKYIDTTKNINISLLQIRQLGGGCVRHDAFFERVAFFCS